MKPNTTLVVPVTIGAVTDEIKHIADKDLRKFHKSLFGTEHAYLNGMDRIVKVAEQFKPIEDESKLDLKAKELIALVYGMNQAVYQDHIKTGISFDVLLSGVKFPKLSSEDNSILINIAPPKIY